MARFQRIGIFCILIFALFGLRSSSQDLCGRVDMKPVLTLEQVRMADMADLLCTIAGLKNLPSWPKPDEIAKMTPEDYYKMETKALAVNGFPSIFMDIEPDRLINRRFFSQLMYQIAMETDDKVKQDCKGATTETDQLECLVKHNWVYSQAGKLYREEILSVLCEKKKEIQSLIPPPVITPAEINPLEFKEGVLEIPATSF